MKNFLIVIFLVLILAFGGFWWLWGVNFQSSNSSSLHATETTDIKGAHVSLAISDILIFKTPDNEYGAIQFVKMTSDSGADYKAWFIPSPTSVINLKEVKPKDGHVFEKYWRTRIGSNDYHVTDIGGIYTLECGPIKLNWSASTWVYFPPGYNFTVINDDNSHLINILDSTLKWHKT